MTEIGGGAFDNCSSLTSIRIPAVVTEIGNFAFYGCSNLTNLELPAGVKKIETLAFDGCSSLKDVYYGGSEALWKVIDIGDYNEPLINATIHYNSSGSNETDTGIPQYQLNFYSRFGVKDNTFISLKVDWDWKLFDGDSASYGSHLAVAGLMLSAASENTESGTESMLKQLGFDTVDSQNYQADIHDINYPGVTFAHKELLTNGKEKHIFAIVVRGTTDGEDFLTDYNSIGGGFLLSRENIMSQFNDFVQNTCKLNMDSIAEDSSFFVTGHSLGGAVANLIAKKLNDRYGKKDVFAYTFAAPRSISWESEESLGGANNIYNILNEEDGVTTVLSAQTKRYGKEIWFHRYHYAPAIYENFKTLTNGGDLKAVMRSWLNIASKKQHAHSVDIYLSYLLARGDAPNVQVNALVLQVFCPVDIEVYVQDDSLNTPLLVGRVQDNVVDESVSEGTYIHIDGDKKYIYLPFEGDYRIELTGTDNGTMDYSVQEVCLNTNEAVVEKLYENVALDDGKRMTSLVSVWDKTDSSISTEDKIDTPQVRLLVLDDNGNAVKEVLPDGKGTELPVSGQTDGGFDGILPGDIPSDGKIPEGLWIAAIADITYTGEAVTPDVHVYDGNVRLKENIDYKVSYKNNKNAAKAADTKAPTVTVTGRGNYSGKETAAFAILPVDIGGSEVSAANFQVKTGNKAVKPVPELYYLGTKLSNKRDFTVAYANASGVYAQAGEYDVTATGKGNYTGTRTLKLKAAETVVKAKPVSLAKAALGGFQQTFAYTGQACRQQCTLTVKMPDGKNRTLAEGTDYTVLYANDKKAGKATVTYCGKNGFTGKLKKTYKIQPYNIQENAGGKIQYAVKDCVYAKGGSKPKPDIRFDGAPMKEGTDYTLSYQNNKAAGGSKTPTVTVTGKGSFTGKIQIPFAITPQDLSNMTLVSGDRVYKKKADIYRIAPKLMDLDGKLLTAGKDFDKNSITYAYENDVSLENGVSKRAGDAVEKTDIIPANTQIRITLAKGSGSDYTGTYVGSYRITKADIGSARVTVSKQSYTGQEVRPDQSQITVKLGGKTLSSEDYRIVRYDNNVDKGKASVVLAGKGNYGGVKTVNFTIRAKGFLWWWRPFASTARWYDISMR